MLKIITYENPILRQKAKKLSKEEIKSKKIQTLAKEMTEAMIKNDGVGLAAPQINESICIIVVKNFGEPVVMINPEIYKKSWRKETGEEGCLSIPGFYCQVKRHKKISVRALDINGEKMDFQAEDMFARVIQHETDHLKGILITDANKKCEKPIKA
jgi:peptide deformylase